MNKKFIVLAVIIGVSIVSVCVTYAVTRSVHNDSHSSASGHNESAGDGHGHGDSHGKSNEKIDVNKASDETNRAEVTIEITDFAYAKPNLKISKGTTVTWTNRESIKHNVMGEHKGETQAHDAPSTDQVKPDVLAGPLLGEGESYSFTFTETGTFKYHCSPHPYMTAFITVV